MKRIPRQFMLLGHTIHVRIVSKRDWEELAEIHDDIEDCEGFWIPDDNLIVLLRQQPSKMFHCFGHELMHAILYYSGSSLWADENLVDRTGALLAQALSTFQVTSGKTIM